MFDPYSQISAHARKEAFLHPQKFITWQDVVRENPDSDLHSPWQTLSSAELLHTFAASLWARLLQWRWNGSQRYSREAAQPRQDTTPGRHSPA